MQSVEKASKNRTAGPIDFSLFTDGLKAEREQGITIDVAYRYFATARRKFILADTPGHEQYTRNMATGASTADRRDPARRCAQRRARAVAAARADRAAARHLDFVLADQQDGSGRLRPRRLRRASATTSPRPAARGDAAPDSAQRAARRQRHHAAAIARRGSTGRACSSTSRRSRSIATSTAKPFRFPVQLVLRPDHDFRGYAGQIASGTDPPRRHGHGLAVRRATRVSSAS